MNTFLYNHFESFLTSQTKRAFSDFSQDLVCIVNINNQAKRLHYSAARNLLSELFSNIDAGTVKVLVKECSDEFGVLTLSIPRLSSFLSYTCIVENGKISRITLYVPALKRNYRLSPDSFKSHNQMAKRKFYKHALAMMSANADVIVRDYADDAVVITNLADHVCSGKPAIHAFCSGLMKSCFKIIKGLRFHGFSKIKWQTMEADGLLLFVCEAKCFHTLMTETYWVPNGKIKFEASVCKGDMLRIIRNCNEKQKVFKSCN